MDDITHAFNIDECGENIFFRAERLINIVNKIRLTFHCAQFLKNLAVYKKLEMLAGKFKKSKMFSRFSFSRFKSFYYCSTSTWINKNVKNETRRPENSESENSKIDHSCVIGVPPNRR